MLSVYNHLKVHVLKKSIAAEQRIYLFCRFDQKVLINIKPAIGSSIEKQYGTTSAQKALIAD
jgi:hypothetical protein